MIKPILFNSAMVRAILDERKTMTRRVVKLQVGLDNRFPMPRCKTVMNIRDPRAVNYAPYAVGDVLWVRERWAHHTAGGEVVHAPGDGHPFGSPIYFASMGMKSPVCEGFTPWKPSIHMPKWACRLWLRVANVRVERLQDIDDDGAVAEGCLTNDEAAYELFGDPGSWPCPDCGGEGVYGYEVECTTCDTPRKRFMCLWDSLAKPGTAWSDNPWVWVVEFERCEKPEGWPHA